MSLLSQVILAFIICGIAVVALVLLSKAETKLFGTSHIVKLFSRNSRPIENRKLKVLAALLILAIPIWYSLGCNEMCRASIARLFGR